MCLQDLIFYLLTEEYETPGSLEGPSRDPGGASPEPCTPPGAGEKCHPLADCSRAVAAGCCLSLGKQRSCAVLLSKEELKNLAEMCKEKTPVKLDVSSTHHSYNNLYWMFKGKQLSYINCGQEKYLLFSISHFLLFWSSVRACT